MSEHAENLNRAMHKVCRENRDMSCGVCLEYRYARDHIEELQAEIERLMLRCVEIQQSGVDESKALRRVIAERDAEVERLRGLVIAVQTDTLTPEHLGMVRLTSYSKITGDPKDDTWGWPDE